MKKILSLLVAIMGFSAFTIAQNYTEVVYLKNGSMIKGVIIEQVPNVSLKIKTADGSIFAYDMLEVEKITKEESVKAERVKPRTKSYLKGYKGFIDAGLYTDVDENDAYKLEISTSHGYQFNDFIFLGAGMAVSHFPDWDLTSVPLFVNFRANFTKRKVAPFGDFRIGYSVGDIEGVYASTAIGVRFALRNKKALNLRLEYSAVDYDTSSGYYDYNNGNSYNYGYSYTYSFFNLGIKFGFEF